MAWQDVVAEKQRRRTEALAPFRKDVVTDEQQAKAITAIADAELLLQKLARRELTAEQVIRAYIWRAVAAHDKTNCLTEVMFEDALKRARELDAAMAKSGPVGPLHGLPVTLKDQFDVRGYDSTIGYVGRAGQPAAEDSVLVKLLTSLGAVVLAKTNLPQSIMWCETENPLWGLTTNPQSAAYTPGGSTGGEAALLAEAGSLIGFGTDIGGSIRIPSHMMGLYGLKPSSARLPYRGVPVSTEGEEHVPSSVGPLARSLSSLRLVTAALVEAEPWRQDARCATLPWRPDVYNAVRSRPLTIGLFADDGVATPHPPVSRVLAEAAAALRAAGHEVIEWTPQGVVDGSEQDLHAAAVAVMDQYYAADGGEDVRRDMAAGGEPMIPHVRRLFGQGQGISVYDYWQLNRRKQQLQHAYLDKWSTLRSPVTGRSVDVLLTPPMPHVAVPHGGSRWVGYTKVWNVLDYPALVLPAGRVKEEDLVGLKDTLAADAPDDSVRPSIETWCSRLWTDNAREMARLSLPVGVQLVGRRLDEETVLAVGEVLDELLKAGKKDT